MIQNGSKVIKQGEVIYKAGENVTSISLLLKGKVSVHFPEIDNISNIATEQLIQYSYPVFTAEIGTFLGANDIYQTDTYSATYLAEEECQLITFGLEQESDLKRLYKDKKEYVAFIVRTLSSYVDKSKKMLDNVAGFATELILFNHNLLLTLYHLYKDSQLNSLQNPIFTNTREYYQQVVEASQDIFDNFDLSLIDSDFSNLYNTLNQDLEIDEDKAHYYSCLIEVGADSFKNFFTESFDISEYHIQDATKLVREIKLSLGTNIKKVKQQVELISNHGKDSAFDIVVEIYSETKKKGIDNKDVLRVLELVVSKVAEIDKFFEEVLKKESTMNIENIHKAYMTVMNDSKDKDNRDFNLEDSSIEAIMDEVRDSAKQILEYAQLPQERVDVFFENIKQFRAMKDKLSAEGHFRTMKTAINNIFFEAYEASFMKYYHSEEKNRVIEMFLNFGFFDELLLDKEQIVDLYNLSDAMFYSKDKQIYGIYNWLEEIYLGNREPSINEFDQDYYDHFRDLKKRQRFTEEQEKQYMTDKKGKVHFEIFNMFRVNHRLCFGQLGSYISILHRDMFMKPVSKSIVTKEMILDGLQQILDLDFSAFHRELFHHDPDKGIEKELVMKAVFPDIILLPTFGKNGIMWQEISGRKRDTPGRFLIPMFTAEKLEDILMRVVGRFRWELCRTMQGGAWNDILTKSLTSEYADYVQFYRKNKLLSEEAKAKLKTQIQKNRNLLREIFATDYETWLKYESKGALRLNKVTRGILYTYCPFNKEVRQQLEQQPIYTDAGSKFNQNTSKKVRELNNKYSFIKKNHGSLAKELEDNLAFYLK